MTHFFKLHYLQSDSRGPFLRTQTSVPATQAGPGSMRSSLAEGLRADSVIVAPWAGTQLHVGVCELTLPIGFSLKIYQMYPQIVVLVGCQPHV